jgi:hypothetical protein
VKKFIKFGQQENLIAREETGNNLGKLWVILSTSSVPRGFKTTTTTTTTTMVVPDWDSGHSLSRTY